MRPAWRQWTRVARQADNEMSFAGDFTFARARAGLWRDSLGRIQLAAIDTPRFTWDGGTPQGLLIEPGTVPGTADIAAVRAERVPAGQVTVLHLWSLGASGAVQADAHYAVAAKPMIDGCLARAGRHRWIGVIEGYLHNWDGAVWALGRRWALPAALSAGSGALADQHGRPLIGL